jgi:uncharacterized membrane protein YgaE (UPF0421/DUF939 family)
MQPMRFHSYIKGLQLSVRSAVAAGIALAVAEALRLEFPLYAMIAAVIVTDLSPAESRKLGVQRLVGTMLGGVLGAGMSALLPHSTWAIALAIFGAMLLCYPLKIPAGAKLAGYTCGIVMLSFSTEPWTYAFYRFMETVLGVVVAILVSLVPKLMRTREAGHD